MCPFMDGVWKGISWSDNPFFSPAVLGGESEALSSFPQSPLNFGKKGTNRFPDGVGMAVSNRNSMFSHVVSLSVGL